MESEFWWENPGIIIIIIIIIYANSFLTYEPE
jgi:hypothetical protein